MGVSLAFGQISMVSLASFHSVGTRRTTSWGLGQSVLVSIQVENRRTALSSTPPGEMPSATHQLAKAASPFEIRLFS